MIPAHKNRAAILADLRSRGLKFRIHPDTGEMQFLDAQGVLNAEERDWLDVVRKGLTQALRREAGLCERCGLSKVRVYFGEEESMLSCHDCRMEVGMPIHQRLMQDKRLAAAAKKKRPDAAAVNPDFGLPGFDEEGETP